MKNTHCKIDDDLIRRNISKVIKDNKNVLKILVNR